jgi:glycosyltransferase involved in cell wall biosynthesis
VNATSSSVSVVVPARNAARTIAAVLTALSEQSEPPDEVIVVDDGSTDGTPEVAAAHGARVVTTGGGALAGGARNAGWEAASSDVVCFLDSDAVPAPGWGAGLRRAVAEYPGAIVGCARTFTPRTPWGWVAHLQIETPYLPRGEPRSVRFVSSYCMAVPRGLPLRFSPSYGGEDCVFCADAVEAGVQLVFDPRFHARHDHDRTTFADMRHQQRRLAFGLARCGAVQKEGVHKRVLSRVPLHYFALARLVPIFRRVRDDRELRDPFLRFLPRLVIAEWSLGLSACRYVLRRPAVRGTGGAGFRTS